MNYDDFEQIKTRREGKVLFLTLSNAPVNSISARMHKELSQIFYRVQLDPDADVIVLTGEGKYFSGGGDVPSMKLRVDNPEVHLSKNLELKQAVFGLMDLEKPIIARINGDAIGFGATLSLLCDMTFACDSARIGDPHVKVGYACGDGAAAIWPQLIGFARAKQYLMTGDFISAPEAVQLGLINASVPAGELDAKVNTMAQRLATGARYAVRWTKTSINLPLKQIVHSVLDASMAYQTVTNTSADHREAVDAFLEKRKPEFTGRYGSN